MGLCGIFKTVKWKTIDNYCRHDKRNICTFLESKFDKSTFSCGNSCVDWLGFSLVFYTKMELINHFLKKITCLKTVLFVLCWKYFAHPLKFLIFQTGYIFRKIRNWESASIIDTILYWILDATYL